MVLLLNISCLALGCDTLIELILYGFFFSASNLYDDVYFECVCVCNYVLLFIWNPYKYHSNNKKNMPTTSFNPSVCLVLHMTISQYCIHIFIRLVSMRSRQFISYINMCSEQRDTISTHCSLFAISIYVSTLYFPHKCVWSV